MLPTLVSWLCISFTTLGITSSSAQSSTQTNATAVAAATRILLRNTSDPNRDDPNNPMVIQLAAYFESLLNHSKEDLGLPPLTGKGPVVVELELVINHLLGLSEVNMDFTMDVILRHYWTDHRLSYPESLDLESIGVPDRYYENVWLPDTSVEEGKEEDIHDVTMPNRMFRIYRNDTVIYSQRLKFVVWCAMYLKLFPLDRQYCDVKLASFRYTDSEVNITWREVGTGKPVDIDKLNPNEMAMFELTGVHHGACTQKLVTGNFSCVNFTLGFDRQFGYYLIQVYVPSILIVMLSWVSFWLDPSAVPARISLGILTLLAMTNQMSATSSDAMPRVSYVKSLDVWLTTCIAFLTAAMLEYAVVNTLMQCRRYQVIMKEKTELSQNSNGSQDNEKVKKRNTVSDCPSPSTTRSKRSYDVTLPDTEIPDDGSSARFFYETYACCIPTVRNPAILAYKMDRGSRYVFPLLFGLFNACYWLTYGCILQPAPFHHH